MSALALLAVVLSLAPALLGASASAVAATMADMAIASVSDYPDPVFTNQSVAYTVSVENLGPAQATGVKLTTALPSGVRFEPLQSDPACTESGGVVTCNFASWDANAAGLIRIAVTPSTAGILELTFTVSAAERDRDLSNNSRTETTTVVQPADADISINLPTSVTTSPVGVSNTVPSPNCTAKGATGCSTTILPSRAPFGTRSCGPPRRGPR